MTSTSSRIFALLLAIASGLACGAINDARAQIGLTDDQPLTPPTNIQSVIARGGMHTTVSWNNVNEPGVSEFHLFRFENYSPDTTLKTLAVLPHSAASPKVVTYTDNTTQPNRMYTYFLTCKDQFGHQSNNSKMTTITIPPAPAPIR